jgi:prepilin-type N-terminal cleavage/methylation domain-containing protein/prepilin-type processing-associated H-X9-DG protein
MKRSSTDIRTVAHKAFTLIELLVVMAIIALLVAILLPSLTRAKAMGRATSCAGNLRTMALTMAMYTSEYGVYPPSYAYPYNKEGDWDPKKQDVKHPYGYLHWSHLLLSNSEITEKAFKCPSMQNGGIPRTNPGADAGDWETGQKDQNNNTGPNKQVTDRQAPRVAYTGNAAVIPRNKFTTNLVIDKGGLPGRENRFVAPAEIPYGNKTIMLTEYLASWRAITDTDGATVKSHRPISAFYHLSTAQNEYAAPPDNGDFVYGESTMQDKKYGLLPLAQVMKGTGVIAGSLTTELNAVGRHHYGGDDSDYGGTANFLYCDGHAELKTVLETLEGREWGHAYYSLKGANKVLNY